MIQEPSEFTLETYHSAECLCAFVWLPSAGSAPSNTCDCTRTMHRLGHTRHIRPRLGPCPLPTPAWPCWPSVGHDQFYTRGVYSRCPFRVCKGISLQRTVGNDVIGSLQGLDAAVSSHSAANGGLCPTRPRGVGNLQWLPDFSP